MENKSAFMFTHCNVCNYTWYSRQDFIVDRDIEIIGYQVNFKKLEAGFLYFNHRCGNTIVLSANRFVDLYNGPIFEEAKTGTDECPGYCLNKEELRACRAKCECAYIREIIQLFKGAENIKIA